MLVTDALVLCRHMARVQVIEADKLLLYMDLPPDRAEEQKTDIRAREQAYWEGITPLPIFLSGDAPCLTSSLVSAIFLSRPSPKP